MIGVFDSGFGGLTILKELQKKLPQYSYIYLGDTGRTPYGEKSKETVISYSTQASKFLFSQGAKLIIFACVTASSLALREVQNHLIVNSGEKKKKILGVLRPIVEAATTITKSGRLGVIGTRGTILSQAFDKEIAKIDDSIKVFSRACPLFVPLIEEDWTNKPETRKIAKTYLRDLVNQNIDLLILGCTHYPIIQKLIQKIVPKKVRIPCIGSIVADSLEDYIARHPEVILDKSGQRIFFSSDTNNKFENIGSKYLGSKITGVRPVNLANYG